MLDQEAARLLAELRECVRLSRAARSALTDPVQSVNTEGYRKLAEMDAAAGKESNRAREAFRGYRRARRSVRILLRDATPPIHMVFPCADETRIDEAVSTFVASGIRNGDAVVLLTTTFRRAIIEHRLKAGAFDVKTLQNSGQLVFMDAATLIFAIMADGVPDVLALKNRFGTLIEKASLNPNTGEPRRVRIFGEVVNLLYMAGNISAATLLEELDNEIIAAHPSVSLFCAYSLKLGLDRLPQSLLDPHSHDLSRLLE